MQPIKTVSLDSDNSAEYHDFLEEFLTERANELIQAIPNTNIQKPISLGYSLSNSQGDGVGIIGGEISLTGNDNPDILKLIEDLKKEFKITEVKDLDVSLQFSHQGRYYHERSFSINVLFNFLDENENYLTQEDSSIDYEINFIETYRDICKKLEKYGYALIESEDEEAICTQAFIDFCKLNHIETDNDINDFHYTTDASDNVSSFTHIATEGDTSLDGLWILLPSIEEHTRDEQYRTLSK